MEDTLREFLLQEGYSDLREIDNVGICGVKRFLFTTGLLVGMDSFRYVGRYCYETMYEAKKALENWNGAGHPSGDWIKYKGQDGGFPNPIHKINL